MYHTFICILMGVGAIPAVLAVMGGVPSLHQLITGEAAGLERGRLIGLRNLVGFILLAAPCAIGIYLHGGESRRVSQMSKALGPVIEKAEQATCEKAGFVKPNWRVEVISYRSGKQTVRRETWTFHCVDARGELHEVLEPTCNSRRFGIEARPACEDSDVASLFSDCGVTMASH